jgi:hypothetical protein
MYKYLQKNQKKILAVFAAGLMIVFILPAGMSHFGNQGNMVVGQVGNQPVHAMDLRRATQQWQSLKGQIYLVVLAQGQPRLAPLATQLGVEAQQAIDSHNEMYLLLQLEAQRMGVQVSVDRLESLLQQRIYIIENNQPVPYTGITDPDVKEAVHQTVANFMLVQNAAERAASTIKISQPMLRQTLATQWQRLTVSVADYSAAAFKDQAKAPTTQQLDEQFRRYADVAPDSPASPMGFGYRYPDRVKLQYIQIPWAQVRNAARSDTKDYDWKVKAYQEYVDHPERYQSTPASEPTTSPSPLGPTSPLSLNPTSAPTTGPTTKPFEAVVEDIRNSLVKAAADQKLQDIQKAIENRMQKDYEATLTSPATSSDSATSTTQPAASSLGVPYNSFEYLQKLAQEIDKQFQVRPTVVDVDQFKSAEDLAALSGIGEAHLVQSGQSIDEAPAATAFATYAISDAAPLMSDARGNPSALPLYKLSMPLNDSLHDVYYFRLSGADPAHPAKSLAEVQQRVAADVQTQEAYDLAKQKAQHLLEGAQKQGLAAAAQAAGVKTLTAGPFIAQSPSIANYELPPGARERFLDAATNLLTEAGKTGNPHPVALVELPQVKKVAIVQLQEVEPLWQADTFAAYSAYAEEELAQQMRQSLLTDWFNYDALVQRIQYVPTPSADQT